MLALRQRRWLAAAAILAIVAALLQAPIIPLAVVAAAAVVLGLVMLCPQAAIYLLVVMVPFQGLRESDAEAAQQITPTEPLVALLLVAAWCYLGVTRPKLRRPLPLLVPSLVLLLGMLVSINRDSELLYSLKQVLKWLEFLGVYLAASYLIATRRQVWILLALVAMVGVAETAIGLFQVAAQYGPDNFVVGGIWLRAYGSFGQPNPYAGFLNLCLSLMAAVATALSPGGLRRWWVAATLFVALGVLASLSRGAILSLAIALLIVVAKTTDRGRKSAWLILLGLCVLLFAATFVPQPLVDAAAESFGLGQLSLQSVTPKNFSAVQRLANWLVGWQMFLDNPWLGVGIGNFASAYSRYAPSGWEVPLGHAHNYYLTLMSETGLVGLGAFLFFSAACLRAPWRAAARLSSEGSPDRLARALCVGVFAMFVTVCLHNLVDDLFVHGVPVFLGILLALPGIVLRWPSTAGAHGAAVASSARSALAA